MSFLSNSSTKLKILWFSLINFINNDEIIKNFLSSNHLYGFVESKIKIGLFIKDNLNSLMILDSYDNESYELLRVCNKFDNNFDGTMLLFKYFIEKYDPNEIISYSNRSWPNKNLYERMNFKLIKKTKPNYYYIIGNKRFSRFNFRKNELIKEGFDSNKTEHQIMIDRKIYRIYDSGNLKFVFKKNN